VYIRNASETVGAYLFLALRTARVLFEKSANDSVYSAMVSGIVRLCRNCLLCGHSIRSTCFKIFKWCEIVAGVTANRIARSRQVRLSFAAMALNIRNRVSSANAFDMFSIHSYPLL